MTSKRVLLTWEMGNHLGHLSKLLAVARRLKARGCQVLVATRDVALAGAVLGPAGISFVQAPRLTQRPKVDRLPASYADLLWYEGWNDPRQLWSAVLAWVNLIRLYGPQVVVADYSPTALLAARVTAIRPVLIGTGFELPPLEAPLPAFPGFADCTLENAAHAEQRVLQGANQVLRALRAPLLRALRDLFESDLRILTTFPDLDHYGPRAGERYVGPIGEVSQGQALTWPAGYSQRIVAYLRPEVPNLLAVIDALATSETAAVICYGPGIDPNLLPAGRCIVSARSVNLRALWAEATLSVSYASAGMVTESLLRGVPQLLAPVHAESQLGAARIEYLGAGLVLKGAQSQSTVSAALGHLTHTIDFKLRAATFGNRHRGFDRDLAADSIVDEIDQLAARAPERLVTSGSATYA